ncbi:hypothetical protein AB0O34_13625 [Sphaerisporangium sp. NPDC088356]|uniref:hypothetical protein n=1 Tax=Sphaerisporangium sp. NPDC088356 TaxID=3154871 RepID=UPI00342999BE
MTRHYFFMCHSDPVVAELVRRGNRVTYLTAQSMAAIVEKTGRPDMTVYDTSILIEQYLTRTG